MKINPKNISGMGVEEIETGEPRRAERKTKTKGILKNSGETKKSRKHHSNHGKHVEINLEQSERKHRSRKHRDENRDSGIYDTPKGSTVKWKEDLNAAYERSRQRSLERSVSAVNRTIVTGSLPDEKHVNLNTTKDIIDNQG